jgi:integrase
MMAKRRGNNEGSIYKDKRGFYRGAATLPDGTRRYVSGATREECSDKLIELQADLPKGIPTGDTDTVAGFLAWWLARLEAKAGSGKKSTNTVDNARWAVDKWITPALGTKRLRDLSPEDVERLLDKMAAAGRSHRTVVRVKSYLGQALEIAQNRRKVSWNVARVAEMPETVEPPDRRSLTPDEAKEVLAAAEGHRLEGLFVTAMMLGLRPGELTGLRWSDIDLANGTLTVAASLKSERGQLRLGETKTRQSRTVNLPEPVWAALRAHDKVQKAERLKVGAAWRNRGLVFTTEVGTPIDPSNLRRAVKGLCEDAGVEPVSPNELGRHTAASLLYDAGMNLEDVAELLGHKSTRMLEAHYRHRVRPSFDRHVQHVEAVFGAR